MSENEKTIIENQIEIYGDLIDQGVEKLFQIHRGKIDDSLRDNSDSFKFVDPTILTEELVYLQQKFRILKVMFTSVIINLTNSQKMKIQRIINETTNDIIKKDNIDFFSLLNSIIEELKNDAQQSEQKRNLKSSNPELDILFIRAKLLKEKKRPAKYTYKEALLDANKELHAIDESIDSVVDMKRIIDTFKKKYKNLA